MRVASMFSGIGGIDLGFQQAGYDIVWANEIDNTQLLHIDIILVQRI